MDAVGVLQVVRLVEYTQAEQVLQQARIAASGVQLRWQAGVEVECNEFDVFVRPYLLENEGTRSSGRVAASGIEFLWQASVQIEGNKLAALVGSQLLDLNGARGSRRELKRPTARTVLQHRSIRALPVLCVERPEQSDTSSGRPVVEVTSTKR